MGSSAPDIAEIAVIGAGVVGLTIAYRLALEGREVVMIDPQDPGHGASQGSAGTVADYAVMPVGTPDVLRNLPSLLLDRNSPLAIRRAALPPLMPWLLRFAKASLPRAALRNAHVLAGLLADAGARWKELAAEVGGADILRQAGVVYAFETARARSAAKADLAFRRNLGVNVDFLSPEELTQIEPALPSMEGGGAFFPDAISMTDPKMMTNRLAQAAIAAGVVHLRAQVERIDQTNGNVRLTGPGLAQTARTAIIAAGAHSRLLARQVGDRVPLDTERGYHVEYDMRSPRLSRPVSPIARGFYLCPMKGRLRVAGTVELGGLTAPPSPHRIRRLHEGARAIFPDLPEPSRDWMGFRPSLPDSLPVIGASQKGPEILLAFGHGHLGLTLAPVTAAIVADLIAGRSPHLEIRAVSPARF